MMFSVKTTLVFVCCDADACFKFDLALATALRTPTFHPSRSNAPDVVPLWHFNEACELDGTH